jgi:hypothetical protein
LRQAGAPFKRNSDSFTCSRRSQPMLPLLLKIY